ncbi:MULTISPECIES: (Fe-S)-binding protein [Duncaniella]|uniref:(Fe-S)-binding protein n=1 Tax=Duncaniella TaxID=2518495 RepID=UPI000E8359F5|nr:MULTISPECIES: (Fe-S)-binding protein [Duncaniella]MBJ2191097.1 (Fe-S)-binding protein [Muribaculaceae bacterium]MCX4283438.1 (Fe-S)-binding protein [Duncaniella dubosii]HBN63748.1 Fe-S oxidoreductase [Porphyromonadaceae bacterium]
MKVGFFVPCYVDMLAPQAAIASYELLKRFGLDVCYIEQASCCGLPMTDMGYERKACHIEQNLVKYFSGYDYVVIPSGICTDQVRYHLDSIEKTPEVQHILDTTHDVVDFLHDILQVKSLPWAKFPHRVALHNGCHSLRFLHQARPTELMIPDYSKTADLLNLVEGLEVCYATRRDECCGFGGTFAIWDQSCACQQGLDKVSDYAKNGLKYVTSADFSCLMHQQGIARKFGIDIKTYYIAEILNGTAAE